MGQKGAQIFYPKAASRDIDFKLFIKKEDCPGQVAQVAERRPMHQKLVGSVPSQGT